MLKSLDLLTANDRPGQHATSWYAATASRRTDHPSLAGAVSADVVIVGGGYTGLSSALHLAEAGLSVVVLEAHRIGWGASGRNGGQVGSGQRLDQITLEDMVGKSDARLLWDLAEDSKAIVHALIGKHQIDCDYRPGILYADHRPDIARDHAAYADHLARHYGYHDNEVLDRDSVRARLASPLYHGGVLDKGAGHVHPLNLALGIGRAAEAAGVRIFETSTVTGYRNEGGKVTVTTAAGSVTASHMVLACNGYLGKLEPKVAAKVMPINNFIIVTEPLGAERAEALIAGGVAVADSKFVINYFRMTRDHRLLFGGGETYGYRFPANIPEFVRRPLKSVFPQLGDVRIDYGWGGTLAITPKRMPLFTRLAPNVVSASGYSGHGVAMACLAGRLIGEAVTGRAGGFDVFERLRIPSFPGGARMRFPLLVAAMTWFSLRDRLGI
ncbi:NAD(P)/FAD-dependent oxidoreductase [Pannonibacter tanglangensis]|uniref:FAD-dependent oxidoreductase n=1 Tax=Pannonibacter tanglangensis TaxID=2750084 RepID=A0ABW9ZF36_9HYPH|nr:FAD-binding oxidoreductase [Pannonibacter sp. XCT-34]NBN63326.1 FAD-dependent oxidoreductase [Pannonibacter sp. XCT-34]